MHDFVLDYSFLKVSNNNIISRKRAKFRYGLYCTTRQLGLQGRGGWLLVKCGVVICGVMGKMRGRLWVTQDGSKYVL